MSHAIHEVFGEYKRNLERVEFKWRITTFKIINFSRMKQISQTAVVPHGKQFCSPALGGNDANSNGISQQNMVRVS